MLRTGYRVPQAHRDNLTGDERIAALLEDLLDKQTEVWRWNVGPYTVSSKIITNTTVVKGEESVIARFTNPNDLGGAVIVGIIALTSTDFNFRLMVDTQTIEFVGSDILNADITFPYSPGLMITRRDPVVTVTNSLGLTTALYDYLFTPGDPRGQFWRYEARMSILNTGSSSFTISKSQAVSKVYSK